MKGVLGFWGVMTLSGHEISIKSEKYYHDENQDSMNMSNSYYENDS